MMKFTPFDWEAHGLVQEGRWWSYVTAKIPGVKRAEWAARYIGKRKCDEVRLVVELADGRTFIVLDWATAKDQTDIERLILQPFVDRILEQL